MLEWQSDSKYSDITKQINQIISGTQRLEKVATTALKGSAPSELLGALLSGQEIVITKINSAKFVKLSTSPFGNRLVIRFRT